MQKNTDTNALNNRPALRATNAVRKVDIRAREGSIQISDISLYVPQNTKVISKRKLLLEKIVTRSALVSTYIERSVHNQDVLNENN